MFSKTKLSLLLFGFFFVIPWDAHAAPQVTVSASPAVIYAGESTTLTWTVSNGAQSCVLTGAIRRDVPPTNGSLVVNPVRDDSGDPAYVIMCFDADGQGSASVNVGMVPKVTVSIDPTSSTSLTGTTATLTWASDGDFCTDYTGTTVAAMGSIQVHPSRTTTYTISCFFRRGSRNGSGSATITISPAGGTACPRLLSTSWGKGCWGQLLNDLAIDQSGTIANSTPGYSGQVTVTCTNPPSGLTQSNVSCVGSGAKCTGVEPWLQSSNTEAYPGDMPGPTDVDTPWTFSGVNTSRPCEFHCQSGYEWKKITKDSWGCGATVTEGGGEGATAFLDVSKNGVSEGENITLTWNSSGNGKMYQKVSFRSFGDFTSGERQVDDPNWNDEITVGSTGSVTLVPRNHEGVNAVGEYIYRLVSLAGTMMSLGSTQTVRVYDLPTVTLEAKPATIDPGQSSRLEWNVSDGNVSGCYLFGEPVKINSRYGGAIGTSLFLTVNGDKPANTSDVILWSGGLGENSKEVTTPSTTKDYMLICHSPGFNANTKAGFVIRTARVTVNGTPDPISTPPNENLGPSRLIPSSCSVPNSCLDVCAPSRVVGYCSSGGTFCCAPTPMDQGGGSRSSVLSSFSIDNPLRYGKVNELLGSILTYLQGIIVLLSIIMIVIGGFFYITSTGDQSRTETAKKCILGALIGLALGIAAPAFLKEVSTILRWDAVPVPTGVGTSLTLLQIAERILSFLLTIIGILTVIMLIIGGIIYLTAAGDEDRLDRGKKLVKYSLIGITAALASLVLVKWVASFLG